MPNKTILELIASQAKYISENIKYMWPDELRAQISSLKQLV